MSDVESTPQSPAAPEPEGPPAPEPEAQVEAPDDPVLTSRDGAVLTITLNRPDKLNAFNGDVHLGFAAALKEARADDIRAVVITGAGRGFCVGQDLAEFRDAPDESPKGFAAPTTPTSSRSVDWRSPCSQPSTAPPPAPACPSPVPATCASPPTPPPLCRVHQYRPRPRLGRVLLHHRLLGNARASSGWRPGAG